MSRLGKKLLDRKGVRAFVEGAGVSEGVTSLSLLFLLFLRMNSHSKNIVCIFSSKEESLRAHGLFRFLFGNDASFSINVFEDYDPIPYKRQILSHENNHRRVKTLFHILTKHRQIVFCDVMSFLRFVPPLSVIERGVLSLKKGEPFSEEKVTGFLERENYVYVTEVRKAGEYSFKRGAFEVFSPYYEMPVEVRIENSVVSGLKAVLPQQNGISENSEREHFKSEVLITPLREFAHTEEEYVDLLKRLKEEDRGIFQSEVEKTKTIYDMQNYTPLFLKGEKKVFYEYFPEGEAELYWVDKEEGIEVFEKNLKIYRDYYYPQSNLLVTLAPEKYFLSPQSFLSKNAGIRDVYSKRGGEKGALDLGFCPPSFHEEDMNGLKTKMGNLIDEGYTFFISSRYQEEIKRFRRLLECFSPYVLLEGEKESGDKESHLVLIQSPIDRGFENEDAGIIWLGEKDLWAKRRSVEEEDVQSDFDDFLDMNEGDLVVHVNHGIGRFLGIHRMSISEKMKDYLKLIYSKGAILYVPVEQINLVHRYVGKKEGIKLDDLGSINWEKSKKKVKKEIDKIVDELVQLYSKRSVLTRPPFPPYNPYQTEFDSDFAFEETRDQLKACEEIEADMEGGRPMDRLLCGDVGYGKTEVAMRCAFKCVLVGKQVSFLCPTTILSEQHYHTFKKRFEKYPVTVEVLNRFKDASEVRRILDQLQRGKVDILIGTHRILSKDVVFENLGLFIIDEEQKFGVKQKEKIRNSYSPLVDTLSLTATPIPRTLHLSLLKLRSLSLLKTPPQKRLPVELSVSEFDEDLVKNAILNEVQRGGQVFFLHNRIEDIYNISMYLKSILPEDVRVVVAHGKMESEVEEIMLGFMAHRYDVLLSTAIIDSGIDIPNANTIIINNAHHFGLSQLYQLKGRVGRSERQGYAYLLYSKEKKLSEEAAERLEFLTHHAQLGSGFEIAMKDIEMRGVGNLLGEAQSGHVSLVGYEMYCKLLEERVDALDGNKDKKVHTQVDVKFDGLVPEEYVPDVKDRMSIYKNLGRVKNRDDLNRLWVDISELHGEIPPPLSNLFLVSEIRILGEERKIDSIEEKDTRIEWILSEGSVINVKRFSIDSQKGMRLHSESRSLSWDISPGGDSSDKLNKIKSITEQFFEVV